MSLFLENETYLIRKAVFEVYNNLGVGFLESVYQEALEFELLNHNIPFVSQKEIKMVYKSRELSKKFAADLICYDKIIIELKAQKSILPEHRAQLINYLKLLKLKLGLIVNFGSFPKIQIERMIL